jgi:hypothetical protein
MDGVVVDSARFLAGGHIAAMEGWRPPLVELLLESRPMTFLLTDGRSSFRPFLPLMSRVGSYSFAQQKISKQTRPLTG